MKALVARAASTAGWDVGVEHRGDGWVADVLARSSQMSIAIEVQWSQQALSEYERRQSRYADSGVRGLWLVRSAPPLYRPGESLPLFVVRDWRAEPRVVIAGGTHSVDTAVSSMLAGDCRWRESSGGRVETRTERVLCQLCGASGIRSRVVAIWCSCETCGQRHIAAPPLAVAESVRQDPTCGCRRPDAWRVVGVRASWLTATVSAPWPHWCVRRVSGTAQWPA